MNHPFTNYRSLFPILNNQFLLASCSQSAIALPVSNSIEQYIQGLNSKGTNWEESIEKLSDAKKGFAKLIGAEPEEIAILSSVSDIISSIATSLIFEKGKNKIVTTESDFPTVSHIWYAQSRFGADVIRIPTLENRTIPVEFYEKYVTNETLLTSISHVSYHNSFIQDIKAISDIVHRKGSLILVDAYQSAGHIPIDVKEMDIDILTTGTRKYLLGIPGIAFLYMKKELADQWHPRTTGWFGQHDPPSLDLHHFTQASGTSRFETGTPSFISAYAACSAIDLLLEIGISNIYSYLSELSQFSVRYGQEKGLNIASPLNKEQRGTMTAFYVNNAKKVEENLKKKNIIVSSRENVIRIAPHFYNTKEEIEHSINQLSLEIM